MTGFELSILYALQGIHSGILDALMVFITNLGNVGAIWLVAAAVCLLMKRTRMIGLGMMIAIAIAFIVGDVALKPLTARVRPCNLDTAVSMLIARPDGFSFPSGHTSAAFSATTVLYLAKSRLRVPATVLALLVAFSRLYLFVHFPTDVLAGALLGVCCGWLGWYLCRPLAARLMGNGRFRSWVESCDVLIAHVKAYLDGSDETEVHS